MADLVIKNGLIITPQGVISGGVAVEGERIVDIGSDAALPKAKETVDAEGLVVFPGIIDPHHHMGLNQPWEQCIRDFTDESIACAVGGVTSIVTTPGGPMTESLGDQQIAALNRNKEIASKHSLIDFRITEPAITPGNIELIPAMVKEHGVTSFKFPLVYTGPEGKHFGISWFDFGHVFKGFEKISQVGAPALAMIHAEESAIIEVLKERMRSQGKTELRAWSESRPNITEAMHVFVCGLMAMHLNCPLYVVHTSAKESVDAIQYFKGKGVRIYGETTPHYLAPITMDADIGTIGVVNPPLRTEDDAERLWKGLADGTMDTIGSDHCGSFEKREDKEKGGVWECVMGFPGTGAILPILMEGVHKRKITLQRMAQVCCENTAKIYSMYPKKGALIPGADADILIIDPDKEWIMGVKTMKGHCDWSIWEGRKVKGKVIKTYVRGKLVQEDGKPVIKPPYGTYISPIGAHVSVPTVPL